MEEVFDTVKGIVLSSKTRSENSVACVSKSALVGVLIESHAVVLGSYILSCVVALFGYFYFPLGKT